MPVPAKCKLLPHPAYQFLPPHFLPISWCLPIMPGSSCLPILPASSWLPKPARYTVKKVSGFFYSEFLPANICLPKPTCLPCDIRHKVERRICQCTDSTVHTHYLSLDKVWGLQIFLSDSWGSELRDRKGGGVDAASKTHRVLRPSVLYLMDQKKNRNNYISFPS